MSMTVSQRMRLKLAIARPALDRVSDDLIRGAAARRLYPEYLHTLHALVRASVPLLERARSRCETLGDPLSMALAQYYDEHAREEAGHDRWLIDDLAVCGWSEAEVMDKIPPPAIAAMVGAQYYWIEHDHPVAFIGYIAMLEGAPASTTMIDTWQENTGWPREAFRSVEWHGALDPMHRDDLDRFVDVLPLSRRDETLIGLSLLQTVRFAIDAFSDLIAHGRRSWADNGVVVPTAPVSEG